MLNIRKQITEISRRDPNPFIPFIGTLFLFIALSNILSILPAYHAPTGSLSTTTALSLCVFIAVPYFGIRHQGVYGYFKHYFQPTVFMFPFHVIGEISRTVALAIRLFGNIMSGAKNRGYFTRHCPAVLSHPHACLGIADRPHSSLHFCHIGHGLYCFRHALA